MNTPEFFAELTRRAQKGELTTTDMVAAHNALDGLWMLSEAMRYRYERISRHRAAVDNYATAMRPRFGLEMSLPNGDREADA